jgi:uncharacterized protein involved in type VI secretion and phage assembly
VYVGIVDENRGDGAPYHVRLRLPWLSDDEKSTWARIAVPMAGHQRGTYVLPEVGDQVLVVFERGDADRPIVIGAAWSDQTPPPEDNTSGDNNTKVIKSRTGHRVLFSDEAGVERIVIVDSTGQNKLVLDGAGKKVMIESAGDITIKAAENVVIDAKSVAIGTGGALDAEAAASSSPGPAVAPRPRPAPRSRSPVAT